MNGPLLVGAGIVGWVLFAVAVTLWRVTCRQAREAQARERVQAAVAAEAVEEARRMEADARRWREQDPTVRREREQFDAIAETVLSDMPDVARWIEDKYWGRAR